MALQRIALAEAVDVLCALGAMAKRSFPPGARSESCTGFFFSVAMLPDDLAYLLARIIDGGFFPGRLLMSTAAPRIDPELGPRIHRVAAFPNPRHKTENSKYSKRF
jgi:hypothetical protein